MISSLNWVPRGAPKAKPVKYEVGPKEMETIKKAQEKLKERLEEPEDKYDRHGLPKELRMDDYGEDFDDVLWEGNEGEDEEATLAKALADHAQEDSEEEDEDLEGNDNVEGAFDDESKESEGDDDDLDMDDGLDLDVGDDDCDDLGSDAEDFEVRNTDRMILVAQTDEEFSNLEVYIYDQEDASLYVHHDIALPAFPLCAEWVGCNKSILGDNAASDSQNYVAVGTFKPEIELWNLDVLDVLEPTLSLNGHSDAVMGLAWNKRHPHLLASGSADTKCLLWDLTKGEVVKTFSHHTDKVQSVEWNPTESTVLLTGSFDKSLAVLDAATDGSSALRLSLSSDVECSVWNPHSPQQVLASTEDGKVTCFDVRNPGTPVYSFQAHDQKPCSSISLSLLVRGLMATCSPDKTVKIWDLEAAKGPTCVASKAMAGGALFDVAFDVSEPYLLCAGGDKGVLALWDISEEEKIARRFSNRFVFQSENNASPSMEDTDESAQQSEVTPAPTVSAKKEKKKKKKGEK